MKIFFLLVMTLISFGMQSVNFQTHTTSSFRIRYEKGVSSKEALNVGTLLEEEYTKFKRVFNSSLSHKIDVYIYKSMERLQKETSSKLFDDGMYKGGKMYLVSPAVIKDEDKVRDLMTRMTSKAVLGNMKSCPAWLAEAYSLYVGNASGRFGTPSRFTMIGFSDLSEDFNRMTSVNEQKEVYAKLAATMDFFINRYGEKKVIEMLGQFKSGRSMEEVFETTFGEKIDVIEKEWSTALSSLKK